MGGPFSVTFSDIYKTKIKNEVVTPLKPKFYRRYVDDIFNRREKDAHDFLFNSLKNYNQNIKLSFEISPTKFLDAKLNFAYGIYKIMLRRKTTNC